jgi:RND family efflux transporter MFP subunit
MQQLGSFSRTPGVPLAWIVALAGFGVVSGCGGPEVASTQTPSQVAAAPVVVTTTQVTHGPITRSITLPTFRVLPYQSVTLYAKVAGYVRAVNVDKGDVVDDGQLLAELEVPELLADEMQFSAEASVARGNYERMAEALRSAPDLVVPQTVDELRGSAEVAEAKLARTRSLLGFARITAPFRGVVTARFVDAGAFIPAATSGSTPQTAALFTVMDMSRVRVQVYVPEAEAPFIRNGLPAELTVGSLQGRTFSGAVTRFTHVLDEATKTMLTEIELPNADGALRPGMYADVRLQVERKATAPILPREAVVVERAGSFVFTAVDGKARKTPIRTGFDDGSHVEIVEGVSVDAPVIVVGAMTLTDGQAVTVGTP